MKRRELLKAVVVGIFLAIPKWARATKDDEFLKPDMSDGRIGTTSIINVYLSRNARMEVHYEGEEIVLSGEEIWDIFKNK